MKETFFTMFETFSIDSSPNSLDWFPFFLFVKRNNFQLQAKNLTVSSITNQQFQPDKT